MLAALPAPDDMKIRARITEAVWQRLLADSAHIEAARRAAGTYRCREGRNWRLIYCFKRRIKCGVGPVIRRLIIIITPSG